MYGEFFDIPAPDELVFLSWFSGGEVFRSGCTFRRGHGKVFYFRPGDQEYPTYHHPDVRRVIANAVEWAVTHRPERALPVLRRHETGELLADERGRPMSPAFRRIDTDGPLRLVVIGAGAMGRAWVETISRSSEAVLAGVADLDLAAAQAAADAYGPSVLTGTDPVDVARRSSAHAVVDVTIPEAHHAVTTASLVAGLPVPGEKPVTPTVAQALSLATAAEVTGELFMVSQSRRWNPQLATLKAMVDDVLDAAYETALREEQRPDVRERLASWPSVRGALGLA